MKIIDAKKSGGSKGKGKPKSKKTSGVSSTPSTMKLQDGKKVIKDSRKKVKAKTDSKVVDMNVPKGTIKMIDGKRYRSLGNGNFEAAPKAKGTAEYKKKKVEKRRAKQRRKNTNYKSTQGKKG